jgi:hypothetical protein
LSEAGAYSSRNERARFGGSIRVRNSLSEQLRRADMATHPDVNPDSVPSGPSDSPEQVTPVNEPGRENVEDNPDDVQAPGNREYREV